MDINVLLDTAQKVCRVNSDNALAGKLGVSRQAVSSWRHGHKHPDVITCEKLANYAGISVLSVVAAVNEQREISREAKAVWRRLASAAVVLLVLGIAAPGHSIAHENRTPDRSELNLNIASDMHYAKCETGFHHTLRESAQPCGLGGLPCHACTA